MSRLYLILLLFIILLHACACPIKSAPSKSEIQSNIPNVAQLEMRVKQLYEAENKGDWRTFYNLSIMSLKVIPKGYAKERKCSYEGFEEYILSSGRDKNFKIISWGINKITLSEKPNSITTDVTIKMDVVIQVPSREPEKKNDQTDYWAYIDNSWYWIGRGWPYD